MSTVGPPRSLQLRTTSSITTASAATETETEKQTQARVRRTAVGGGAWVLHGGKHAPGVLRAGC